MQESFVFEISDFPIPVPHYRLKYIDAVAADLLRILKNY